MVYYGYPYSNECSEKKTISKEYFGFIKFF